MAAVGKEAIVETLEGSFHEALGALHAREMLEEARGTTRDMALRALGSGPLTLEQAAGLLSVPREAILDELLVRSHELTESVFHRTVLMFAPCYLSGFCINNCIYCAYSITESPVRRWISPRGAGEEAAALAAHGFRRLVMVAGEYGNTVSAEYVAQAVSEARRWVPEVDLAVGPTTEPQYRLWKEAGADGVTCFQETYDREVYAAVHPCGPKSRFDRRLETLERAGRAGMSRLGLGIFLGLSDPAPDLLALIAHARHLQNRFPSARLTVALPRLECGSEDPAGERKIEDQELLRLVGILRLSLPTAGLIAFPREPEWMRGRLLNAGVTHMTACGGPRRPGDDVECLHDDGVSGTQDERSDFELQWDLEDLGYTILRQDAPTGDLLTGAHQGTGSAT